MGLEIGHGQHEPWWWTVEIPTQIMVHTDNCMFVFSMIWTDVVCDNEHGTFIVFFIFLLQGSQLGWQLHQCSVLLGVYSSMLRHDVIVIDQVPLTALWEPLKVSPFPLLNAKETKLHC